MATKSAHPQTELSAYPIPNMVQGVSQQSAQQRRDTQCEAQFDCLNSPVNGCEARPGFDVIGVLNGLNLTNAYHYEIFRGDTEHYLVVVNDVAYVGGPWLGASDPTARKLHVYDLNTGKECSITRTATEAYLAVAGAPKDKFVSTTLEDTTFLGNREVITAIGATRSPARANDAIMFFKAGGYQLTFQVGISIPTFTPDPGSIGGKKYTWTYVTPDNSVPTNAAYISTNNLAATFYRAFTGNPAPVPTSGDDLAGGSNPSNGTGAGPGGAGDDGSKGVVTAGVLLTDLGFTVEINGNCLRISRADNVPWTIDTVDGVGDTYLRAIKETVQSFDLLPASSFVGFQTKVVGSNRQTDDDYFVEYQGQEGSAGFWQEVVGPDVPLTFDASKMPHMLVNTGVGTFEFKQAPWENRVSGDGIKTSKDPSFVGHPIQDLAYDHGRLCIMWEGGTVWARAKNPFVYFPDTAQTVLDTDPIDIKVGGGKTIALLRRVVQVNEASFLWAPRVQFRSNSGLNPFKQDTVEAPPSTSYEFTEKAVPKAVGESLYFVSEPGPFAAIRDLTVQNGLPKGATDVTEHVPRYVPAGVRWITASDTLRLLLATSEGSPNLLYAYNFLLTATERTQSAWNTWRLPASCTVLWAAISVNFCFLMVQRGTDQAVLLKVDLTVDRVDAETGATYLTRLDMRITEVECTSLVYNSLLDATTITLPYKVPDAVGEYGAATPPMFIVQRAAGAKVRGFIWRILSITESTIVVSGDCTTQPLYIGFRITAEREASTFYLKSTAGLYPVDHLQVKNFTVFYSETGYFRVDVTYLGTTEDVRSYPMTGRIFGDPANVTGSFPIGQGQFKVSIDAENIKYRLKLVNDSFLPSRWNSSSFAYTASYTARPTVLGQGGR